MIIMVIIIIMIIIVRVVGRPPGAVPEPAYMHNAYIYIVLLIVLLNIYIYIHLYLHIYIYIYIFVSPANIFRLFVMSDAGIQSAGTWVTAGGKGAASDEVGGGRRGRHQVRVVK